MSECEVCGLSESECTCWCPECGLLKSDCCCKMIEDLKEGDNMAQYRLVFHGFYLKKDDNHEFLVQCPKEESVFEEREAFSLHKQCPEKIKIEKIEGE